MEDQGAGFALGGLRTDQQSAGLLVQGDGPGSAVQGQNFFDSPGNFPRLVRFDGDAAALVDHYRLHVNLELLVHDGGIGREDNQMVGWLFGSSKPGTVWVRT